ncbi:hypothetical protein ACFSWE_09580 [Leucobacter albus]|uniref:Minor tail protein n=1 Tax=Leucobacter albus TaxID=272210 RepID=A0ABW3TR32_9MICO
MWVLDDGDKQLMLTCKFEGIGLTRPPEVGTVEIETDDQSLPRADGIVMGEDFYGAQTVSFDLSLRPEQGKPVADLLGELRHFWRAPSHRNVGGKTVELRSPSGRSTFGRPRRFSPNRDNEKHDHITVDADFESVSDLWFGASGSALVSLVPPLGRGLVAPLVEPLTIQGAAQNAQGFTVGGEEPAYPVIVFRGPITNPSLHGDGWVVRVRGTLAYDETLTVDTRPWVRSLSLNGRPVAGMLMPSSSRLRDVTLSPGFHSVQLRGTDITGTASALILWREAHAAF